MSFDQYRKYTQARVGLGHFGAGMPTKAWLEFAFDHARAVDAIKVPWNLKRAVDEIEELGYATQILNTKVRNREEYLMRPDRGRALNTAAKETLKSDSKISSENILIVVSNGLSSLAVENHLKQLLKILLHQFASEHLAVMDNRIMLVENARVALIDDVGEIKSPTMGMMIIGERPGLSSCDSLAVYLTYRPQHGRTDAERNCVSNIRPPFGLPYEEAATKVMYLIQEAMRRKLSGVELKDETLAKIPKLNS